MLYTRHYCCAINYGLSRKYRYYIWQLNYMQ